MLEPGEHSHYEANLHPVPQDHCPLTELAPQLGVDHLVPIYNYQNRNARAIARTIGIAALQEGIEVAEIHTVAGGAQANAEVLYDNRTVLGPHALAINIGGDGTLHTVTNGLRIASQSAQEIYQTKRLFHEGGTACDTSKALNKPERLKNIIKLLDTGWLVEVYPLEVHIDPPTDSDPENVPDLVHALSYVSLGGFTGLAAEYINSAKHRERWLNKFNFWPTKKLGLGLTGLRALRDAQKVDMTVDVEPRRSTLDVHCLSGPIMATLKHRSKEVVEPGFHIVENSEPRFGYLLARALQLGAGKLIDKEAEPRLNLGITTHDPAILQADGETWRVPAGTSVSIKPGQPFQAVTTRQSLQPLATEADR